MLNTKGDELGIGTALRIDIGQAALVGSAQVCCLRLERLLGCEPIDHLGVENVLAALAWAADVQTALLERRVNVLLRALLARAVAVDRRHE